MSPRTGWLGRWHKVGPPHVSGSDHALTPLRPWRAWPAPDLATARALAPDTHGYPLRRDRLRVRHGRATTANGRDLALWFLPVDGPARARRWTARAALGRGRSAAPATSYRCPKNRASDGELTTFRPDARGGAADLTPSVRADGTGAGSACIALVAPSASPSAASTARRTNADRGTSPRASSIRATNASSHRKLNGCAM